MEQALRAKRVLHSGVWYDSLFSHSHPFASRLGGGPFCRTPPYYDRFWRRTHLADDAGGKPSRNRPRDGTPSHNHPRDETPSHNRPRDATPSRSRLSGEKTCDGLPWASLPYADPASRSPHCWNRWPCHCDDGFSFRGVV